MESVEAFVRAIKMYFIVGLVVVAIHAVAIRPPEGETRWQRAIAVVWDVVWWPRLVVESSRMARGVSYANHPLHLSVLNLPGGDVGDSR